MKHRLLKLFVSAMATLLAAILAQPTSAQLSFPTAASGVRAPGTVPLQCDASAANCAPVRGDANGVVVQPGLTSTYWQFTSGVTSILSNTTTAVTIKAAAQARRLARELNDMCDVIEGTHPALAEVGPA